MLLYSFGTWVALKVEKPQAVDGHVSVYDYYLVFSKIDQASSLLASILSYAK